MAHKGKSGDSLPSLDGVSVDRGANERFGKMGRQAIEQAHVHGLHIEKWGGSDIAKMRYSTYTKDSGNPN